MMTPWTEPSGFGHSLTVQEEPAGIKTSPDKRFRMCRHLQGHMHRLAATGTDVCDAARRPALFSTVRFWARSWLRGVRDPTLLWRGPFDDLDQAFAAQVEPDPLAQG